jgi:hypothetical protein
MRLVATVVTLALLLTISTAALAQEPAVSNEILVQVNDDVITRAHYLTALEDFKAELRHRMQGRSDAEIDAELEKQRSGVLDNLIDVMLLVQRAKELGLDVDSEVNQHMRQVAIETNLRDVGALEQALRAQGIDPDQVRGALRKRYQQQYVLQLEVVQPLLSRGGTMEQAEEARKQYLNQLREAAYIKVS